MADKVKLNHLDSLISRLAASLRDGSLNQSVLFIGSEGLGKFKIVTELAKVIFCEKNMAACGECRDCLEISKLRHPDFILAFPFPNISPESKKLHIFQFSDPATSNAKFSEDTREEVERFIKIKTANPYAILDYEKKENIPVEVIKDIIHALAKKPLRGNRRAVGIIDIDKMAFGAGDLFLKTVEEPPLNTHLLMTTSRPDLLPQTLLSRALRINVPRADEAQLMELLSENREIECKQAAFLSRFAGGSPGRAVNLEHNEVFERRRQILQYINDIFNSRMGILLHNLNSNYRSSNISFDEAKLDFEIIETVVHDLYLIDENDLEKNIINIDIMPELMKLPRIEKEKLDIWMKCLIETKKACLVNNVSVNSGMTFLFACYSRALEEPFRPQFKLP